MDGIELVNLIRKDVHLKSIRVMVVSYKDREEDRRRGLDAGADQPAIIPIVHFSSSTARCNLLLHMQQKVAAILKAWHLLDTRSGFA